MQDYSAGVTDTRKMGFFIDSFFDIALHVDIHIFMKTPYGEEITLLYKEEILIYELDRWEEWLEFTFPEPGDYWVYFIVVDETGMEWSTNCPWEIESNFFDLHIDQEYHAGVTDVRDMIFHAKSYFNYGMIINISIDIRTPSDSKNLHSEELVEIEAFGFWDYGLEYEFPDPGEYMVTFRVVNAKTGDTWIVECPWKIETDFLGVWIDQDTHAFVGETHDIGFRIKNYYDGLIGMDIDYIAEMHTPSGMTEPLFQHTGVWISAYDEIGIMISYEFTEPGDYKVFFRATDTYGYSWTIDCYWKVEELSEKERFELKIDQNTEANVGDEGRMKFLVNSFFNHAMDVNINITIKTPSGDVETLFNEVVWIDSYGDWEKSIDYEFEEEGDYTVLLVLTDDIGVEWVEDCEWEISEPSTSEIASSEESNPPIITPTPGFGGFTIIGAIVAIATYYRKRHT
ncbi:MAG: hypothetical protein ACFFC6_17800 [Promethearchaeota archaeon]